MGSEASMRYAGQWSTMTRLLLVWLAATLWLAACAAPAPPATSNAAAGAAGAVAPSPAAAPRTVVVATAGWTAFNWGLYAAEAAGYFTAQGLVLDRLVTESPPKTAQVVLSGDAQIGTIGSDFVVNAVERGSNLAIVGAEMRAPLMSMMVQPSVQSWSDLRGKAIGVSGPQVAEALFTQKLLARNGLSEGEVDLISVG